VVVSVPCFLHTRDPVGVPLLKETRAGEVSFDWWCFPIFPIG